MIIEFQSVKSSDLYIDAIYKGGVTGNAGDDPISKILPVGTQGGFRYKLDPKSKKPLFVVLYTSGAHPDWPDSLDESTGIFRYFGDNREPGALNSKPGNKILEDVFSNLHNRFWNQIPPFFIFEKISQNRDVKFLGLAVPGAKNIPITRDLISIWRSNKVGRFQNYESYFTVLKIDPIPRAFINDIISGKTIISDFCPDVYRNWLTNGIYTPLLVPSPIKIRSKEQQLPNNRDKLAWEMLRTIHQYFPIKAGAYRFEQLAADVFQASDQNIVSIDVTRPSRDGGRDAIGVYRIGNTNNSLPISFALEAKCYDPGKTSVNTRSTSRLISRIRHRQFGIIVTTSVVDSQAYKEISDDEHPILIIAGIDIIEILKNKLGISDINALTQWLKKY